MLKTMSKPTSDTYREGDAVHILMIVHSVETGKLCCIPFSNVINDRNDTSIYVSTNDVVKHEPKPRELQVGDIVKHIADLKSVWHILAIDDEYAWIINRYNGFRSSVPLENLMLKKDLNENA